MNEQPPKAEEARWFGPDPDSIGRMWTEFASKMVQAGLAAPPGTPPPQAARQVRSALFKAMADACDDYLRSPQFLEMMRQSLRHSIQLRQQCNEFLGQMWHESQCASRQDVDSLMQVMEQVEKRMVSEFDRIGSQLAAFESRLDKLDGAGPCRKRRRPGRPAAEPKTP